MTKRRFGKATGWSGACVAVVLAMGSISVAVAQETPPSSSPHGRQIEEMGSPSKILSEDQREAAELEAAGTLFPKAAAPSLQAAQPAVSDDFIVFGYIQNEDIVYHLRWQSLTHVGSLFVDFLSDGEFQNLSTWTGRSSYLQAGGAAQAAGVKVVIVVRNDNFNETVLDTVMQSAALRQNLADNVISAVTSDAYCAGVSFDFEFSWGTATRDGITAFLSYLRANLPSQYEISVYTHAIYSSTYWNISGIEPSIDYMLYSTYDWASGNTPHAISDFNNCDNYIADYMTAGLPPEKMVLVWSSYGRQWQGTNAYNVAGSNPVSRGFTDGLYDTTLNPNFGGPHTYNYVSGDEGAWHTWNESGTDYTMTWDSPESLEFKMRNSLSFVGDAGSWAGVRLGGVGFWSLYWFTELSSYDPITLSTVARTRTYPHIYELCEDLFASPGTTRHLFEGYEGLDYRWRDPNESPDTVGDTDNNSARAVVTRPAGTGAPADSTNAMQVTFDFEGATGNRAFFRHEVLHSPLATSVPDVNAVSAVFDRNTKISAYVQTPAAYSGYQLRMAVLDGSGQLEVSDPYTLNASGWRLLEWDLTDAAQINAFTTAEPAFSNGNGTLNSAGGGAKDIGFVGFLIEGDGAVAGTVVFDELAFEHVNPAGKNYTINEFRYNDIAQEFVEIYGPAGAVPTGFQLRLLSRADGTATVINLAGQSIPDDGGGFGYFVVGDPGVTNVDFTTGFSAATDDIANVDPPGLQLYGSSTGCVYDSVVFEAFGGLGDLVRMQTLGVTDEGYPWIGEAANGSTASGKQYTLGRYPDGADTHWNNRDLSAQSASPGVANGNALTSIVTSYDFTSAPAEAFQTYQAFTVASPTGAGLPASPNGGNAHRSVDTSGGGVQSFIGDASLAADGQGYRVTGQIYIPSTAEPVQSIAIGLCGSQGSTFFSSVLGPSQYENGYWLIYESNTGAGLADGRPDHPQTFEFVHASHDNMDQVPVTLLGSATRAATGAAGGAWTTFELSVDPLATAGQQLVAKINNFTVFSGALPAGGPISGAFQVGFRENHTGAPVASEGTWIDGLSVTLLHRPVVINTHPATQSVNRNDPVTFTVVADGTPNLTYQWYKVGTGAISGATSATYNIPSTQDVDAGQYYCRVTNSEGSVDSNSATLTVLPPTRVRDWMLIEVRQ